MVTSQEEVQRSSLVDYFILVNGFNSDAFVLHYHMLVMLVSAVGRSSGSFA